MPSTSVDAAGLKIASAWTAVAITSWADFASMLAALYTLILIGEWLWKKWLRPFFEKHKILARKNRRASDRR